MSEKTLMKETAVYDGRKLWDEILKAIVDTMPEQLFPLFNVCLKHKKITRNPL